jgi:hypothetical protein
MPEKRQESRCAPREKTQAQAGSDGSAGDLHARRRQNHRRAGKRPGTPIGRWVATRVRVDHGFVIGEVVRIRGSTAAAQVSVRPGQQKWFVAEPPRNERRRLRPRLIVQANESLVSVLAPTSKRPWREPRRISQNLARTLLGPALTRAA